jgi:hypothetical protein
VPPPRAGGPGAGGHSFEFVFLGAVRAGVSLSAGGSPLGGAPDVGRGAGAPLPACYITCPRVVLLGRFRQ